MTKPVASAQDHEEPQGTLVLIKKDSKKPVRQKTTKITMGIPTHTWINSSSANGDESQARISKRVYELHRYRGGPMARILRIG
jgi:hypothetical protein